MGLNADTGEHGGLDAPFAASAGPVVALGHEPLSEEAAAIERVDLRRDRDRAAAVEPADLTLDAALPVSAIALRGNADATAGALIGPLLVTAAGDGETVRHRPGACNWPPAPHRPAWDVRTSHRRSARYTFSTRAAPTQPISTAVQPNAVMSTHSSHQALAMRATSTMRWSVDGGAGDSANPLPVAM